MTIAFGGEELYASGPAHVRVGGQSLRHARERPLSAHGERLFAQGLHGRAITQTGTLLADSSEGLDHQIQAIEASLDGIPRTLVDDLQRNWVNVTMVAFEPGEIVRMGTRWKMNYRIEYVQAIP